MENRLKYKLTSLKDSGCDDKRPEPCLPGQPFHAPDATLAWMKLRLTHMRAHMPKKACTIDPDMAVCEARQRTGAWLSTRHSPRGPLIT